MLNLTIIELLSFILINMLSYFYKGSNSEVIPRRNMTDVLNDLIQHVIKHLLTFNDFNAPKSATIYLIKFLLGKCSVSSYYFLF